MRHITLHKYECIVGNSMSNSLQYTKINSTIWKANMHFVRDHLMMRDITLHKYECIVGNYISTVYGVQIIIQYKKQIYICWWSLDQTHALSRWQLIMHNGLLLQMLQFIHKSWKDRLPLPYSYMGVYRQYLVHTCVCIIWSTWLLYLYIYVR